MLKVHETRLGKIRGSSPAEDRYYVVVLFDISNQKKYRRIIKIPTDTATGYSIPFSRLTLEALR